METHVRILLVLASLFAAFLAVPSAGPQVAAALLAAVLLFTAAFVPRARGPLFVGGLVAMAASLSLSHLAAANFVVFALLTVVIVGVAAIERLSRDFI